MTSIAFLLHIVLQRFQLRDSILDYLPPSASALVLKTHRSRLVSTGDLRPFSKPRRSADFVHFPPVDQSEVIHGNKMALVFKRLLFWTYLLIYILFIIAIAL